MTEENRLEKFISCYQKLKPVLQSKIGMLTNDFHATEDILQETMIRGLQTSAQGSIRSPSAWIRRVSYNLAMDYHRERRHISLVQEPPTGCPRFFGSRDQNEAEFPGGGLREIVRKLPERDRKVIVLRYWERLSFHEIGERLDISYGNAKSIACHARHRLRFHINKGYKI